MEAHHVSAGQAVLGMIASAGAAAAQTKVRPGWCCRWLLPLAAAAAVVVSAFPAALYPAAAWPSPLCPTMSPPVPCIHPPTCHVSPATLNAPVPPGCHPPAG